MWGRRMFSKPYGASKTEVVKEVDLKNHYKSVRAKRRPMERGECSGRGENGGDAQEISPASSLGTPTVRLVEPEDEGICME